MKVTGVSNDNEIDKLDDASGLHRTVEPAPTLRLRAAALDAAALAALGRSVPPIHVVEANAEHADEDDRAHRRDTPHTFVLPMAVHPDRATLTMLGDPDPGATFALEAQETTLGRGSRVTVRVEEPSVSRVHARILRERDSHYVLEDLGSTNGTFVRGQRAMRVVLRSGDRIQIGRECMFRFAMVDRAEESFQRRLYESSVRDTLTGLANRNCLHERLLSEIAHARRDGVDVSVLMIDVDHFKQVNDKFGHLAGDQVLRAVALAGAKVLRAGDTFGRYGGEEFVVIARKAAHADALTLAERLRAAIAALRIEVGGGSIRSTVSIGVAALSECELPVGESLLALADSRLYEAKFSGRNRVCGGSCV